MVSFQCEVCNDVIKKPKLDAHRGQCPGAYYSCIDCGVTFNGIEYRSHTKCISEKEKYEKTGAGAIKNGPKKTNGKSAVKPKPKNEVKGAAANAKKRKRDTPSDSDSSDFSEESSEEEVVTKTKKVNKTTKKVKMKESSENESEASSESESSDEEEQSKTKTVKTVTKKVDTKESSDSESDSSDEEETKPKNAKAGAKKDESSDSDSDSSEEESEDEPKPAKKAKIEANGNAEAKPKRAKKDKSYKGYSDNPRERTKQILDKILAARKDGISLHSLRKEVVKVAKVLRLEERQDTLKAMPMKKGKKPKLQHKDRHLAGAKFFKNFKVIARDGEIKMEMM